MACLPIVFAFLVFPRIAHKFNTESFEEKQWNWKILQERYSRGEINKSTFDRFSKDLKPQPWYKGKSLIVLIIFVLIVVYALLRDLFGII